MTNDQAAGDHDAERNAALATSVSLASFGNCEVSGLVLVHQKASQPPAISQLSPTNRAVTVLSAVARDVATAYSDSELIDYEPATTPVDGQVMWISAAAVPLLQAIVESSEDLANLPLFDPADRALGSLRLVAMRATVENGTAVFVQSLQAGQVVARSRRFGVVVRRGVVDVPQNGELLLLRNDVAVVVLEGVAFFRDRAGFQRLFGYLQELQEQASETFATVTAQLQILGIDEMTSAVVGSPAMLGKMASIQRKLDKYPEYREALTMPKLMAFVTSHPECKVEITGIGDAAQLVYRNDPQHRFKILKLLDDDYLRSDLTTLAYEANSKSAPLSAS